MDTIKNLYVEKYNYALHVEMITNEIITIGNDSFIGFVCMDEN